ncbi:Thymosin beta-10 [Tupaia chinensis]|uniref:Thymosin beta-10 n=1 Tax=Tupaia chinensis TaxID=246437 RepID=L8Y2S1_TUPCH|nr:Thymosin beta-10 [Tupaia chinensis]
MLGVKAKSRSEYREGYYVQFKDPVGILQHRREREDRWKGGTGSLEEPGFEGTTDQPDLGEMASFDKAKLKKTESQENTLSTRETTERDALPTGETTERDALPTGETTER